MSTAAGGMVELLRTNDPVLISWLRALLADEDIGMVVLDAHASILEGSANAIQRRVMVADEDFPRAQYLLEQSRDVYGGA